MVLRSSRACRKSIVVSASLSAIQPRCHSQVPAACSATRGSDCCGTQSAHCAAERVCSSLRRPAMNCKAAAGSARSIRKHRELAVCAPCGRIGRRGFALAGRIGRSIPNIWLCGCLRCQAEYRSSSAVPGARCQVPGAGQCEQWRYRYPQRLPGGPTARMGSSTSALLAAAGGEAGERARAAARLLLTTRYSTTTAAATISVSTVQCRGTVRPYLGT
eukprot:SAG31_NODE_951_length_10810_cov_3.083652_6_plen_217_part_00